MTTSKQEMASTTILRVASSLASKGHSSSDELCRIAQLLNPNQGQSSGFDPSLETGGPNYNMQVLPQSQGANLHPGIESYVQPMSGGPAVDNRKIHTLTCTLKADKDVSEADMMNYILKISKELPVDVDSFKWSKSEPKMSSGLGR